MRRRLLIVFAGLCATAAMVWGADFSVFEYRVFRNRSPYGSVMVYEYYAIGEKNQRTEFVYKSTEQEPCANSLFPHSGLPPCWYARRHSDKAIPV